MKALDAVFEGGGARGLAHNGAALALDDYGYRYRRLVGTSAGAISATLLAAGYSGEELHAVSLEHAADGRSAMTEFALRPGELSDRELADSSLGRMLSEIDVPLVPKAIEHRAELSLLRALDRVPGFTNVFSFVEEGGWFSANGFVQWLAARLEAKQRTMSTWTFRQMFDSTGRDLSVVVSDTTSCVERVLNHRTAPDCPVLWGVRMSMSIPFFWPEVLWDPAWGKYLGASIDRHAIVDGGVVSNFALRLLLSDEASVIDVMGPVPSERADVIGFLLDAQRSVPDAPPTRGGLAALAASKSVSNKTLARLERVLNTMMQGNDDAVLEAHRELVCHLPTRGYGVVEFDMSDERIDALVHGGRVSTESYLRQRDDLAARR
jgi:predicted acylesterase/phospholipase RssA